jgi:hypothetical protein
MATITTSPQTVPLALNHFVIIEQLTLRNVQASGALQITPAPKPSYVASLLSPYMLYLPIVLFLLLFCTAFVIQVTNKVRTSKHMLVSIVIALFAASIPAALTYLKEGSNQRAKAGPQEIPQNVRINYKNPKTAVVVWYTDAPVYGGVRYSLLPYSENKSNFITSDSGKKTLSHSVELKNLVLGKTYELEILSGSGWYTNNGSYIQFIFRPL